MINTKPWSGGTEEEYETQHFGFGTQSFKTAIRQMVEQKLTTCVKDMQSYLEQALELNDSDKITINRSCDQLVRQYCSRVGSSLLAIDDEIDRILQIPPNVLLPKDEVQVQPITNDDYEKLKEEVAGLRQKVQKNALMEALLTAEENELSTLDKVCVMAKNDMDIIDAAYKSTENSAIKEVLSETKNLCAITPFMKGMTDGNIFSD